MSEHQESFPVLRIGRQDVTYAMGYDLGTKLTDEQMRRIASKFSGVLSEIVSEVGFWKVLAEVVELWLGTESENDKGGLA